MIAASGNSLEHHPVRFGIRNKGIGDGVPAISMNCDERLRKKKEDHARVTG
jgi:hypothetical protein